MPVDPPVFIAVRATLGARSHGFVEILHGVGDCDVLDHAEVLRRWFQFIEAGPHRDDGAPERTGWRRRTSSIRWTLGARRGEGDPTAARR